MLKGAKYRAIQRPCHACLQNLFAGLHFFAKSSGRVPGKRKSGAIYNLDLLLLYAFRFNWLFNIARARLAQRRR
jgi:hypothetical protein